MRYLVVILLVLSIIGCSAPIVKLDAQVDSIAVAQPHTEVQQPLDTIMRVYLWTSVILIVTAALTK